jgi:tight adherence protein B
MLIAAAAGAGLAAAVVAVGRPPPAARLPVPASRMSSARVSWGGISLAVPLLVIVAAPVVAFAAVAAVLGTMRWRRARAVARDRAAGTTAVIESAVALAAELRAGRAPSDALGVVAEHAGPLTAVFREARTASLLGDNAGEVIAAGACLPGAERLQWVGATWSVAGGAGGRIAGALDRLAESMDHDEELRHELDAALAAPRATMLLLAGLPLLGIAMGESVGAGSVDFLMHRPLGWALLAVALCLDALGMLATRAIVRRVLRQ